MKRFNLYQLLMFACLFVLPISDLRAQKFWLTTYEFPNGPKTGIVRLNSETLIAGYQYGILQSKNDGFHFDNVLHTSSTFSLFAASSGNVFAGGAGKVYRSLDQGLSWDSVSIATIYPVLQFAENPQGHLFAITSALDTEKGYVGDGVFFSDDNGKTWTQRNTGLGNYKSCERITCDKSGKLYLAVVDENVSGNGGLFLSEDNGLSWQHIDIQIDGKNSIPNEIKIANTTGLTVTPDDSLIVSFSGIAVNTLVQLNVKKKITAVRENSFWKPFNITNTNTWWYDRLMGNVFFAKNGDRYSSVAGSVSQGGTYLQKKGNNTWQKYDYGLGLDKFGGRSFQYFTENKSGRIFMIQMLDERIYWTDESIPTSSPRPVKSMDFTIFPNPVSPGSAVKILSSDVLKNLQLTIYDSAGSVINEGNIVTDNRTFMAPANPGIYFVVDQHQRITCKLIVAETNP